MQDYHALYGLRLQSLDCWTAGSNSAGGMDVCLLCSLLCRWQLLLRADPAFRGVLPGVSACDLENS
jgi:hypothetical protein